MKIGVGERGLTGHHTIFAGVVYGPESGKHFWDSASELGTRQGDWIASQSESGEGGFMGEDTLFEGEIFSPVKRRRGLDFEGGLKGKRKGTDDDIIMGGT